MKVIVAPVDAEMGRGNAQLQFLTRSGTNRFRGTVYLECAKQRARRQHVEQQQRPRSPKRGNGRPPPRIGTTFTTFVGELRRADRQEQDVLLCSLRSGPRQHPHDSEPDRADAVRAEWNFSVFDSGRDSITRSSGWNNGNALQVTQPGPRRRPLQWSMGPGILYGRRATRTVRIHRRAALSERFRPASRRTRRSPTVRTLSVQGAPWDTNRTRSGFDRVS